MDTNYIAAHILCTEEEKRDCMNTVRKLMTIAETARRCGLLELEQLILDKCYASPALIRVGVTLVVDGTDPVLVQQILENYLISGGLSNPEFLENMLIVRGILALQQGETLSHIRELLCSFFGVDFREEFLSHFGGGQERRELEELLASYMGQLVYFPKASVLDFIPGNMQNRALQRVILALDFDELNFALAGSNLEVIRLFLKNMGEGRRFSFFESLTGSFKPERGYVEDCQQKVKAVIDKLLEQGEIIVGKPILK